MHNEKSIPVANSNAQDQVMKISMGRGYVSIKGLEFISKELNEVSVKVEQEVSQLSSVVLELISRIEGQFDFSMGMIDEYFSFRDCNSNSKLTTCLNDASQLFKNGVRNLQSMLSILASISQQVMRSMKMLSEIAQYIEHIHAFVRQVNLIALNAAIEHAKGDGANDQINFSSEIKNLTSKMGGVASDVKDKISAISLCLESINASLKSIDKLNLEATVEHYKEKDKKLSFIRDKTNDVGAYFKKVFDTSEQLIKLIGRCNIGMQVLDDASQVLNSVSKVQQITANDFVNVLNATYSYSHNMVIDEDYAKNLCNNLCKISMKNEFMARLGRDAKVS